MREEVDERWPPPLADARRPRAPGNALARARPFTAQDVLRTLPQVKQRTGMIMVPCGRAWRARKREANGKRKTEGPGEQKPGRSFSLFACLERRRKNTARRAHARFLEAPRLTTPSSSTKKKAR